MASGEPRDPKMVALLEVVRELSTMPGESEETTHGAVSTILAKRGEDETLVQQAKSNSDPQFKESPDLQVSTDEAVLGAGDVMSRVSEIIFAGDANAERERQLIARAFYRSQTDGMLLPDEPT